MTYEWTKDTLFDDLVLYEARPTETSFLQVEDSPHFGIGWSVFLSDHNFDVPDREGPAESIEQAKELAEKAYDLLSS